MTEKDTREMQAALAKPFAPEDLEWRLQNTIEESMRGMAVPYVTNRAIQNRLDEVCGPENWYNEFKPWHSNGKKDAQLCGIAIYFEGKGFITKWDGAEDSDIEPIKGGLSDSMKRAAYQRCANRKQIETICLNYLRSLEATKLSVNGHMYFVPRTHMDQVDIFEDFITLLSGLNKRTTPLIVNSFYIIDDAKQREKMTEEFYNAVKKEIAVYQEKCDYLIKSNSQSPAVMERWVLKVQALEEKKRHYEGVLQRELRGLDDEFSILRLLSQELQVRSNSIRNLRFRQKAA